MGHSVRWLKLSEYLFLPQVFCLYYTGPHCWWMVLQHFQVVSVHHHFHMTSLCSNDWWLSSINFVLFCVARYCVTSINFYQCVFLQEYPGILLWCLCCYCRLQCPIVLLVPMLVYIQEWHLALCSAYMAFSLFLSAHRDLLSPCIFLWVCYFCSTLDPVPWVSLLSHLLWYILEY